MKKNAILSNFFEAHMKSRSDASLLVMEGDHPTSQSEKDNCDINIIMKRFLQQGISPPQRELFFADVSKFASATALSDAFAMVSHAQEAFDALPADVRASYKNDPVLFADSIQRREYSDELVKSGLMSSDFTERLAKAKAPVASIDSAGASSDTSVSS